MAIVHRREYKQVLHTDGAMVSGKLGLRVHEARAHQNEATRYVAETAPRGNLSQAPLRQSLDDNTGPLPLHDTQHQSHFISSVGGDTQSLANIQATQHQVGNICKLCGKNFKHPCSLRSHMNRAHFRGDVIAYTSFTPCEVCGILFKGQSGVRVHMARAHRRDRVYTHPSVYTDGVPRTHPSVYTQSHGPRAGPFTSREAHYNLHTGPSHTEDGRPSVEIVADHDGDEPDAVPLESGAHLARIVYYELP